MRRELTQIIAETLVFLFVVVAVMAFLWAVEGAIS